MIQHVLFDADGVLQEIPGGWEAAMAPYVGDRAHEFLRAAWKDELPTLAGDGDLRPLLAARLHEFGVEASTDEILEEVWFRIEVDARSLALVAQVRQAGYVVHVGTNQDRHRAGHMQRALPYDALFDSFFSSHALGVAKPDPRFFLEITQRLGADPSEILFIDDTERNVVGARAAGLPAIRWTIAEGHERLVAEMEGHGVRGIPSPAPGA